MIGDVILVLLMIMFMSAWMVTLRRFGEVRDERDKYSIDLYHMTKSRDEMYEDNIKLRQKLRKYGLEIF